MKTFNGTKTRKGLLAFVLLFLTLPASAQQPTDSKFPLFDSVATAQHHCPFDVVVWLNTKKDTYSVSGPGPNDNKETGAYICQRDADQMDYHSVPASGGQ